MRNRWLTFSISFAFVAFFAVIPTMISAQTQCLFVSSTGDGSSAAPEDQVFLDSLRAHGYSVVTVGEADLGGDVFTREFIEESFDFVFMSETINSSSASFFRQVWIPMFTTELWCSKPAVMGWSVLNGYGNIGSPSVVVTNADHYLAAGFSQDEEVVMTLGTNGGDEEMLTYSRPAVDFIPIAHASGDDSAWVVLGIEPGTTIVDADGNMTEDTTMYRFAAAGMHANSFGYDFATPNLFTFMFTGIDWVLGAGPVATADEPGIPSGFSLKQNYPNPFNPTTKINFTIDKVSDVNVTIYNSLGQEVATLASGRMEAGSHSVTFDASNLPSGIYFYRMKAGSFSQTKKMAYIR